LPDDALEDNRDRTTAFLREVVCRGAVSCAPDRVVWAGPVPGPAVRWPDELAVALWAGRSPGAIRVDTGVDGASSTPGSALAIAAVRSTATTPILYAAAGSGRLRAVAASSGTGTANMSAIALFSHAAAASDRPPTWPVSHVSARRTKE
jgi:hypothetical protein